MATNFVQPGNVLTLTAPAGGVVSGAGYMIGDLFVVALHDAAEGAAFEGQCVGVWQLPRKSGEAWTEGAAIYWDGAECTTTATGNKLIGHAAAAAGDTAISGYVRLNA